MPPLPPLPRGRGGWRHGPRSSHELGCRATKNGGVEQLGMGRGCIIAAQKKAAAGGCAAYGALRNYAGERLD
jgi:hypothetical protein